MIHFITCGDGKERQIYPAKIKHREKIRYYTAKFNSALAIANIMAVSDEKIKKSADAEDLFDDAPYNAMMEIMVLAFGEKYTVSELEEFIDVEMIAEVLEVFYGLSGYKKKVVSGTEPSGAN